jgi:uncharacterized membrane protein SirB2
MLEVYPLIKWAHVSVVLVSGALFAFRGAFVAAGASWPMTPALRYLSYGIDTLIVATAAMLLAVLPVSAYSNGWLALKLALLVVYIVLGSLALKRARKFSIRRICYAAALLVFLVMLAIARTHDPMGPWLILRSWIA